MSLQKRLISITSGEGKGVRDDGGGGGEYKNLSS